MPHITTYGIEAGDQAALSYDPLPSSPSLIAVCKFYRSAGFEPSGSGVLPLQHLWKTEQLNSRILIY